MAIVDGRELCRRNADGTWTTLTTTAVDLSALTTAGDVVFAGTVGAHMLRLRPDNGLEPLPGFDAVTGRDHWHGVGGPIEVRSLTATVNGEALLANVHVGGIPRSTDGGASWQPTIDVDNDVHEVRADPAKGNVVMAAAAVGLCESHDAGRSWTVVDDGMHASYARAVAFAEGDVLVSVSDGPFATRSAIYRRAANGGPLRRLRDGLPEWLDGNVDTRCLGAGTGHAALADRGGNLWVSTDGLTGWAIAAKDLPHVTSVVVT
jgi:hypothetical protein